MIEPMFKSSATLMPTRERCLAAIRDKDARFDGWFFVGVTSTGIYCRPSCPARTPKASNVEFYPTSAAAQVAGFRACKRCRPSASPGSPEWDLRADALARAMRLIADGVVDREGVAGLARRLGYSERHVHRLLTAEAGAGPLALARAARAENARVLLERSNLTAAEIAFASGFSSVRQFNATVRELYAATPTELRQGSRAPASTPGGITLRLAAREPFDFERLQRFFAARAIAGVESATGESFARTLDLPFGQAIVHLTAAPRAVEARFELCDLRDLATAVERVRRLCDLDADPIASDAALAADPALAPAVAKGPGLRVPGSVSANELAIRAVLGQQVSIRGAASAAAKLTELCGAPLARPSGELTHCFPRADAIAALNPEELPMPRARARALVGLAGALASGEIALDVAADRHHVRDQLIALPGIGEWTAQYVLMRALHHPDAFLSSDLGVRHGLKALGLPDDARSAAERASAWSPYRAYAVQQLWAIAGENQTK